MPRGLSVNAKTYTGPVVWLAEITTRTATHYFAEDEVNFAGQTYLPYLRLTSGVRRSRSLLLDAGTIELLNADLYIASLLDTQSTSGGEFEGATYILKQLLVGIEEAVEVLRGRLSEQSQGDEAVSFRLVAELEPARIETQPRAYAQLCTWPFAKPTCGYDRAAITVTENLAEQTADIFSATSIGNSLLAMTTNEHTDCLALITAGTGRGQVRRIKSNSATTLTLYQSWKTTPDATSKFRVVTATAGMPKLLFTSTSALDQATADIFSARAIGASGLAMTVDEHRSEGPRDAAGRVRIVTGTGAGQARRIETNDATTITLATDEPNFNPLPDATSVFRVLYRFCPKDVGQSCEQRGRTQAFNGFPTLSPALARIFSDPTPVRGGGGGGGGGSERGDDPLVDVPLL
ncbi:MAG: hypothetical protein ACE5H2_08510 [Terriglobia bacterium]